MISKILSKNDTGETKANQAGIHVPKQKEILDFFPQLDPTVLNPRAVIHFKDQSGDKWTFSFILYNNKFFGGTRNEFRLTGMTSYIKSKNLKSGDKIFFDKSFDEYLISYIKQSVNNTSEILKLSNNWITVKI